MSRFSVNYSLLIEESQGGNVPKGQRASSQGLLVLQTVILQIPELQLLCIMNYELLNDKGTPTLLQERQSENTTNSRLKKFASKPHYCPVKVD